ncbi:MAG: hypothetical protein AAGJ35_10340, partial [Myxococcota bacterium]
MFFVSIHRYLSILGIVLSLTLSVNRSHAFIRTQIYNGEKEVTLFWKTLPLYYKINRLGSRYIAEKDHVYRTIEQSFATWMQPSCTCLRFEFRGLTSIQES